VFPVIAQEWQRTRRSVELTIYCWQWDFDTRYDSHIGVVDDFWGANFLDSQHSNNSWDSAGHGTDTSCTLGCPNDGNSATGLGIAPKVGYTALFSNLWLSSNQSLGCFACQRSPAFLSCLFCLARSTLRTKCSALRSTCWMSEYHLPHIQWMTGLS